MQIRNVFLILLVLCILTGCGSAQPATAFVAPTATAHQAFSTPTPPSNITQPSGPYLGQQAPGMNSTRFASLFIKGELHTSPVFMPDGSEVYWSSQESRIYTMKLENGYWTQPEKIAFSDSLTDFRDPFISPSGDKLFFLSKGKLPDSDLPEKENIWFVERKGDRWGKPEPLGEEVNALTLHWQISVAASGNLYFTSGETGFEDIYVSKYIDDRYVKAEPLGDSINTEQFENTPYIAPDESYIIFARSKDQSSYPRLYISYADENHNWGEPVLIRSVIYGLCPIVSPDGKYLFFLSSPQSVSWMRTDFIKDLKQQYTVANQSNLPITPDSVKHVELMGTLNGHTDRIMALAFSADGVSVASYSRDRTIKLWDITNGSEIFAFANQNQDINSIAFSPDGSLLASAETIWDVKSKKVLHKLDRGEAGKPAFSPDGKWLAVGGVGRPVKLWDVTGGQPVRMFERQANNDTFTTVFSPDGKIVVTSGYDGFIKLWDVQSGMLLRTFSYGSDFGIHSVVFSPDGKLLASGGTGSTVRLWDIQSGQVVRTLTQGDGLYGLAFSPDGHLLASAGCDRTVRLWNVETGEFLRSLPHGDEVMAVAFSPDGTLLISGGYDNHIYVWGLPAN
jgi:WD40 repeat protein